MLEVMLSLRSSSGTQQTVAVASPKNQKRAGTNENMQVDVCQHSCLHFENKGKHIKVLRVSVGIWYSFVVPTFGTLLRQSVRVRKFGTKLYIRIRTRCVCEEASEQRGVSASEGARERARERVSALRCVCAYRS